ncbi:chemotaxis protein [Lonsdalea britannica]|uniref:Chemotaxis protein n=1 Tax=Lonsdalea britannica TaxID=1082704 RepID=A0AAD0WJP7_9GAMM|nr:methyl-accepting chemotaxis protein [Lonsdalea britannica]AXW85910.1 chemotaxis protein [Lonsdalea britannica]OSM96196.1 chemotaxis protein [Lonsdalea britannica]
MRLSDWKIGYRLAAGFAVLVLMICIVSFVSISRLSDFHEDARGIVTDIYPQTVQSNNLIDNVNAVVLAYQKLLLVQDEEKSRVVMNEIADQAKKITALMQDIDKNAEQLNDEGSKRIMDNIHAIRGEFLISGRNIIDRIKAGDTAGATIEFNTHLDVIQSQYRAAVASLIDHQDDAMGNTMHQMEDTYNFTRWLLLGILASCVVLVVVIARVLTGSITYPIRQALDLAESVAKGDLTSEVPSSGKDEMGQLLRSLEHMNVSLSQIVGQVRDGAESISSAASQIAAGNQDLSARTEEQASSLEQTASSMEELTSTITNTAENTRHATSIADQASTAAKQSSDVMLSVTHKMRGIRDSSQRMAEIIGVIDGIAFQTNILALNAAVEAARAGEQGRGFAVVAGEVRSLAQRSATAAKEIKELIDDSVSKIQEGMQLVDSAEDNMSSLTTHVQDVNEIISEISQASGEQSDGINQINIAVGQIDSTTQQNAALVEESASAALSLQSQATMLTDAVSTFKLSHSFVATSGRQQPQASAASALPVAKAVKQEKTLPATAAASSEDWTSF